MCAVSRLPSLYYTGGFYIFQAFYTILVGHPDLNLCRAYMPYKCHNEQFGAFDYKNPEHIKHWNDKWYLDEDPTQQWVPTDVHGATTTQATGLKPGDEGFKEARYAIGKRTNFAKNYGASYKKIRQMYPNKTEEECHRIDDAYYKAFPGVKTYHAYCYEQTAYSNTPNMFGIKYYNVSGHKLINLLIQGSAAYYLKYKIRELYDYAKANNIKSKDVEEYGSDGYWINDSIRNLSDLDSIYTDFINVINVCNLYIIYPNL